MSENIIMENKKGTVSSIRPGKLTRFGVGFPGTLRHAMGKGLLVLIVLLLSQVYAEAGVVEVRNADSKPVSVKFAQGRCLDLDTRLVYGNKVPLANGLVFVVEPDGVYKFGFSRRGGHGCNGQNAYFALTFTHEDGETKSINFATAGTGEVWLGQTDNPYRGTLTGPDALSGSYTYTTVKIKRKLTAGKVIGSWQFLCQGICGKETSIVKNETTNETKQSTETKEAISVSLTGGMDLGPLAKVEATVTGSLEKSNSESMANTVMSSTEEGHEIILPTLEQRKQYGIFAVWQWVGRTKMSDGSTILIKTNKITCTSDGNPPKYLPGDKIDVGACIGESK